MKRKAPFQMRGYFVLAHQANQESIKKIPLERPCCRGQTRFLLVLDSVVSTNEVISPTVTRAPSKTQPKKDAAVVILRPSESPFIGPPTAPPGKAIWIDGLTVLLSCVR